MAAAAAANDAPTQNDNSQPQPSSTKTNPARQPRTSSTDRTRHALLDATLWRTAVYANTAAVPAHAMRY
jgi:hypothetical protein